MFQISVTNHIFKIQIMQWAKMTSQAVIEPKFVWEGQTEEEKNAHNDDFGGGGWEKQAGEIISGREKKKKRKKKSQCINHLGTVGGILCRI